MNAVCVVVICTQILSTLADTEDGMFDVHCKPGNARFYKCNICWCENMGEKELCTLFDCEDMKPSFSNGPVPSLKCRKSRINVTDSSPPLVKVPYVDQVKTAEREKFPHQVMIVTDTRSVCGGSLISKTKILTAAHCVEGFDTWDLRIGGVHLTYPEEGIVSLTTRKAIMHSMYQPTTKANDIAIIEMETGIRFDYKIGVVRLPAFNDLRENYLAQEAIITGWGTLEYGYFSANCSRTMHYAKMRIISNEFCHRYYDMITPSMMCALGVRKENTCYGDVGGPLLVGSQGDIRLVGVASFIAFASCNQGFPAVYTRVANYLGWIADTAPDVVLQRKRARVRNLRNMGR